MVLSSFSVHSEHDDKLGYVKGGEVFDQLSNY